MSPHHPIDQAILFLCCTEEDCARFTAYLREERLHNEVHHVVEARELVATIERDSHDGARALVILDTNVEHAWPGYDALRACHLRGVPVIAICEHEAMELAYAQGVNAVLPRGHWHRQFARTAARLTSFWLRLVRLPQVPPNAETKA